MTSQPELMRGPTGGQLSDSSRQQALSDFLRREQPLANVVGFGHGVKWSGGEPTGRQAVLVPGDVRLQRATSSFKHTTVYHS